MTYQRCTHRLCTVTCRNTKPCENDGWKDRCEEGCVCPEGKIWDHISNKCIEPSMCNKTEYAFPSGYIGPLPGPWQTPSTFRCCHKEPEALQDMVICSHGDQCFKVNHASTLHLSLDEYEHHYRKGYNWFSASVRGSVSVWKEPPRRSPLSKRAEDE